MKKLFRLCAWTVTTVLVGAGLPGWAADSEAAAGDKTFSMPWEKGAIMFGGFVADFSSDLTVGREGGGNRNFNAEDRLNLDSSLTVLKVGAFYRPGESRRNQLDFTYAAYQRSGSSTLSKDLQLGDTVYPIGAQFHSTFNFDIISGTYSYAFVQNERWRLALGLGVYAVPLKVQLNVKTGSGHEAAEHIDTTLPLPMLALRTEVRLVGGLFLNAAMNGFYLQISDFEGYMADLNVGLEYRFLKHFGIGLAYNYMNVDVQGKSGNSDYPGLSFVGEVGVQYSGALLYGKVSF